MAFKVIDLFCGAGGFARGFINEGFEVVLAIDNFQPVVRTYRANFPQVKVLPEDIQEVHGLDILSEVGVNPDVVIASPPCEPFTAANVKRLKNPLDRLYVDPIGRLVLHTIRIIGDLKPRCFVVENVPQILEGDLRAALRREFARVGYRNIFFNVLRAEDYGTPSRRVRVFISNLEIKPPPVKRRVKVIEAIGDLPDPSTSSIPNHELTPLSPRKLKRIVKLRWGEGLIHYVGARGKTYPNWVRLHPYRLAPPILGSSRFIHPFEDRLLTVREQARLMGFPDNHLFLGGRDVQYDMVGEAVPVQLAEAIASYISTKLY